MWTESVAHFCLSPNGFLRIFMYNNLKFQGFPDEFKLRVERIGPHILGDKIKALQETLWKVVCLFKLLSAYKGGWTFFISVSGSLIEVCNYSKTHIATNCVNCEKTVLCSFLKDVCEPLWHWTLARQTFRWRPSDERSQWILMQGSAFYEIVSLYPIVSCWSYFC